MLSHSCCLPVHSAVEQSALVLDFGESKEFQKHEVHIKVKKRVVKREERTWPSRFKMHRSDVTQQASACCTQVSVLPFPGGITAEVHLEGKTRNGLGIKCFEINIVN